MHFKEWFMIVSVWLICFISILFIPKQKYRQASFIFVFAQLPAWIFGLAVVEAGLIKYPVRVFSKANGTSFTFEYLALPFICIFFNLYFPENKGLYRKVIYYMSFLSFFTLLEYFVEKYTLILKYVHWNWYTTFTSMALFMYLVRLIYKWFYNLDKPFSL